MIFASHLVTPILRLPSEGSVQPLAQHRQQAGHEVYADSRDVHLERLAGQFSAVGQRHTSS